MNYDLETVNRLYLELSQFATAKTARELALADALKRALDCAYWKARPCVENDPWQMLKDFNEREPRTL